MADMRKILGYAYGSGPGIGGNALIGAMDKGETLPGIGSGGAAGLTIPNEVIDNFMASYKDLVPNCKGNYTGYIINQLAIPAASAMTDAEKLAVLDMMRTTFKQLDVISTGAPIEYDFYAPDCGSWHHNRGRMIWKRGYANPGADTTKNKNFVNTGISASLLGPPTNMAIYSFTGIDTEGAVDNAGPAGSTFAAGGWSGAGVNDIATYVVRLTSGWYLKILDEDCNLVVDLATVGTLIENDFNTEAYHEGNAYAEPVVTAAPLNSHMINPWNAAANGPHAAVCVCKSLRWQWNSGATVYQATTPAYASAYYVGDCVAVTGVV